MVKTLLLVCLMVFAVMGICEFIYILRMLCFFPGIRTKNYALIVLKKGRAVAQLNFIWQKIKWQGDGFAVGIIAIIDQLETSELLSCQGFIKQKNILLCSSASFFKSEHIRGELFNGNR